MPHADTPPRAAFDTPRHIALRLGLGFFAIYLGVMTAAMLSPRAFDLIPGGIVGLAWPASPDRVTDLLVNMNLCGLVPNAFMAARTGFLGEWTPVNRAYFLVMLGANIAINVWSIMTSPAMGGVLAGDFAIVVPLFALALLVPPTR